MSEKSIHEQFVEIFGEDDDEININEEELLKEWYRTLELDKHKSSENDKDTALSEYKETGKIKNGRMVSYDVP